MADGSSPTSRLHTITRGVVDLVATRISIDTRSLAVFRVMIGALVVVDVLTRAGRFTYFYTEEGVVPLSLAIDRATDGAFSVYFFTTDSTLTAAFFVVQGIVGLLLVVGYQTRVMSVLAFLLVISLNHRNPLINSYADTLFRLLLFWAMFLPLGERWSIDGLQLGKKPRSMVAGLATAAILLQMVYMYLANGLQKLAGGRWADGAPVPLTFGLDDMTFLLGDSLRAFPGLLAAGGVIWFYLMLGSPLLLILKGRWRMPLVGMLLVGHLMFAFTVRIGSFAYVAIAGLMLFVPAVAWSDGRRVLRWLRIDQYRAAVGRWMGRAGRHLADWLPRLPSPTEGLRGLAVRVGRLALVFAVAIVLVIPALDEMPEAGGPTVFPSTLRQGTDDVARMFGVHQPPWTVFAPNPRRNDRWYVFAAQTVDGEWLDVYNDRPLLVDGDDEEPTFERPHRQLHLQYRTYRERFYMNSVRRNEDGPVAQRLAAYLCERAPEDHGTELKTITFYVVSERVTLETIDRPEDRETTMTVMSRHECPVV